ncbi:gamma-glutamyltransferase [Natronococcus pandeyae]|uniref:gamma-glutamyltransferase n=1 Tax=Natronococcus pandeyae TaxID=2055836 RepID=UPI0016533CFB|nr:gamma-glutamyltransferase [Natronococcus pandeyae]
MKGTAAVGIGVAASTVASADTDGETADDGWEATAVTAGGGMVSSSHPLASEIGANVLADGGNAFDAAAATQFALAVVEPNGSGLGGSDLLLAYDADDEQCYAVDGLARSPIEASPEIRYDEDGEQKPPMERSYGGIAVGTPGTVRTLDVLLKRWGTRSIREVVGPAADLAAEGFEVDQRLAETVGWSAWRFNDAASSVFAPDDEPVSVGDTLVQDALAETLRLIESDGIDPFYRGEIADAIVEFVRSAGGVMSASDLRSYRPTIEPVPSITFDEPHPAVARGGEIRVTATPPSSYGVVVLGLLKLIEDLDIDRDGANSIERYHYLAEARRLASAPVYATGGDPEFVDVPARGMLADEYIDERRDMIDPTEADFDLVFEPGEPWSHQPGRPYVTDPPAGVSPSDFADTPGDGTDEGESTTHFVTADSEGNVVSCSGTLSANFGTGAVVPDYGFFLNNSVSNMSSEPGPDQIAPLRRYSTSMCPTMALRDGKPLLALGSPGGGSIPRVVAGVLTNVLVHGMSLAEAISHPRMYMWTWEAEVDSAVVEGMRSREHDVDDDPTPHIGDVQAIRIDQRREQLVGVADPRRGGAAIGTDETS